jgi:cell wall assembly regulator SMI1
VESNYPELYDQLSEPVTPADLNEIEMDLDCSLPLDVRDSYMVHDGQERGGRPTGLFFGITFLDLESVVEEWTAWKNTAVRLNNIAQRQAAGSRTVSGASTSSMPPPPPPGQQPQLPQPQKGRPRGTPFTERQESVPDGHIQKVYAHPAWIPLAKDFEGNNIGVDLAPGPSGRWGQVILFGRNFDRKYAIAPSWASFLATFAEDLYSGDHYIDDDLEDGAFIFRAPNGRQMSYFDVLRGRVERTLRAQKRNAHAQPRNSSSRGPSAQQQRAAVGGSLISPVGSTTNLTSTDKPATSSLSKSDAPGDKEAVEDQVLTPEPSKEPSEAQQQPSVEPQVKDDDAKNEPNGGSEPRISNGTSEDAPSSSIPPEDVAAKAKSKKNKKKNNKSADKADDVAADNDDAKDEVDLLQDDLSEVEM